MIRGNPLESVFYNIPPLYPYLTFSSLFATLRLEVAGTWSPNIRRGLTNHERAEEENHKDKSYEDL